MAVVALLAGALGACDRREPREFPAGDSRITSTAPRRGEQTLEPAAPPVSPSPRADAGVEARSDTATTPAGAPADETRPSWVPKDASFTIVTAADLDKNLGIVTPAAAPNTFAVDAGSCEVGIQVRPKP